ncbi:hypothetical protein NP522_19470 [Pseudomonas guariconensis]|uniref:hypothetical protein n=1 Tax=Pseudomonas guariconensis TaxID=1288410 RepID=UPI0023631D0D|nr:hypothetical protein [Pseudomonas guariconensis]MDD2092368.1 hypothetical protein [Pseudomonas guariconensis]
MPEENQLHPDLARIYDIFGLHHSHPISVLEVNVRNTKRFSDLLQAVESEFLMVPGTPSDEPEDEGCPVDDECLVNRWGSTQEEYIEQFRAALDQLNGKSRVITLSGCEFTEDDLLARAVRGVSGTGRQKRPRWALMTDVFLCGSGVAHALCRRFGLDPDEDLRK